MIFFKYLFISVSILLSLSSHSAIQKKVFTHENFEVARDSDDYLNFMIKSTKVGIWTSEILGYVRNFKLVSEYSKGTWNNSEISFKIRDLDTDINARDEKMHMYCLNFDKSKVITIKTNTPLKVGKNMKVPAKILIRGNYKNIGMILNISKSENGHIIEGVSTTSFKHLDIPNPSNFFAKVDDAIKLSFKLKI